jgi:hypothetical protein
MAEKKMAKGTHYLSPPYLRFGDEWCGGNCPLPPKVFCHHPPLYLFTLAYGRGKGLGLGKGEREGGSGRRWKEVE